MIRALPRPANITAEDVDDMIAYVDRTIDFWNRGIERHKQAGRTDFIDKDQILAALDDIGKSLRELEDLGAQNFDFGAAIVELNQFVVEKFTDRDAPPPVKSRIFFVLKSESSGFVQRGFMTGDGRFPMPLLAPDTFYSAAFLDPNTLNYATSVFVTGESGSSVSVLPTLLYPFTDENDAEGDGLPDVAEFVVGTDPDLSDTDGDGITDLAEIQQGTNPLDDLQAATGIIASSGTPGTAKDVCAVEGVAIVADGLAGVRVFNVSGADNPIAGDALAVDCEPGSKLMAVADGPGGLAVIDVTDPPAAFVSAQVPLGGVALGVAVANRFAFVAMRDGRLMRVDLETGTVLGAAGLANRQLHDVIVNASRVYALGVARLHVLTFGGTLLGSVAAPGIAPTSTGRRRLIVAEGLAYATNHRGYDVLDVTDPQNMSIIFTLFDETPQFGRRDIALNGSGWLVASVGPNGNFDKPEFANVSVYDQDDPANDYALYPTPYAARAVSIFNGLAYVADGNDALGDGALHVVNFLEYDQEGNPPEITSPPTRRAKRSRRANCSRSSHP